MIALHTFEPLEAAVSLLYPPVCAICGESVRAGEYLCNRCEAKAIRIVAPFCQKCSEPFEGSITSGFTCANFRRLVGKYVRPDHVRTTKHWMRGQAVVKNELAEKRNT